MLVIKTIIVAFSMFSSVPMPNVEWNKDNMRYSLCAFPLIGALIGLICWAAAFIFHTAGLPSLLLAAVLTAIPVLITGGIHIDGFADTSDALASHAPMEKKHEILKDPHVGSFAVIKICLYYMLTFAFWACLIEYRPVPVLLCFILSRSLSGLAVTLFPLAKNTGLAHAFAAAADKKRASVILFTASAAISVLLCICGIEGVGMAAAAWIVFAYYKLMSKKQFGGLTGDLAGWFLCLAELWMLIALVIIQYLEKLF